MKAEKNSEHLQKQAEACLSLMTAALNFLKNGQKALKENAALFGAIIKIFVQCAEFAMTDLYIFFLTKVPKVSTSR